MIMAYTICVVYILQLEVCCVSRSRGMTQPSNIRCVNVTLFLSANIIYE